MGAAESDTKVYIELKENAFNSDINCLNIKIIFLSAGIRSQQ